MNIYEWRYLLNGKVKHALARATASYAVCGTGPVWFSPTLWLGTDSAAEIERAEKLRACRRCVRIAGTPR